MDCTLEWKRPLQNGLSMDNSMHQKIAWMFIYQNIVKKPAIIWEGENGDTQQH